MRRILIFHQNEAVRARIAALFKSTGLPVEEVDRLEAAEAACAKHCPDVLIADAAIENGGALALLRSLKSSGICVPCSIVVGATDVRFAVEATKAGAHQVLAGRVEDVSLLTVVQRVLEERMRQSGAHSVFVGTSPAIRALEAAARQVLASESPIFIHGETGTGKGVLARWLRQNGPRASEGFVDLNCATLGRELLESELFGHERGAFTGAVGPKQGLFETAHGGTVFLDEVGDLDLGVQPKLLKVLEEKRFRRVGDVIDRPVDVRFITATHQDLETLIEEGRFRRDLYYRICILPLRVPALRERTEDIPLLAQTLIEQICRDLERQVPELTPLALAILQDHPWPGNVRELRNALERALLATNGPVIDRSELLFLRQPSARSRPQSFGNGRSMTLTEAEGWFIKQTLEDAQGRVELAAIRLGISRSALYNKIKKHGLGAAR